MRHVRPRGQILTLALTGVRLHSVQMVHLDPREQWVLANATHFVACAFRGRGKYERVACVDLDEARTEARRLLCDRPVAIYAICGLSQTLVELAKPSSASRTA